MRRKYYVILLSSGSRRIAQISERLGKENEHSHKIYIFFHVSPNHFLLAIISAFPCYLLPSRIYFILAVSNRSGVFIILIFPLRPIYIALFGCPIFVLADSIPAGHVSARCIILWIPLLFFPPTIPLTWVQEYINLFKRTTPFHEMQVLENSFCCILIARLAYVDGAIKIECISRKF